MEDIKIKKMEINESQKKIIEATVSLVIITAACCKQFNASSFQIFKINLGPFKTATRSVRGLPK